MTNSSSAPEDTSIIILPMPSSKRAHKKQKTSTTQASRMVEVSLFLIWFCKISRSLTTWTSGTWRPVYTLHPSHTRGTFCVQFSYNMASFHFDSITPGGSWQWGASKCWDDGRHGSERGKAKIWQRLGCRWAGSLFDITTQSYLLTVSL